MKSAIYSLLTLCRLSLPSRECGLKFGLEPGSLVKEPSLPSRECGLKFGCATKMICTLQSLPSRECGLKYVLAVIFVLVFASLPSRECGLKFAYRNPTVVIIRVTPFAGVWIEISGRSTDTERISRHSLRGSVD